MRLSRLACDAGTKYSGKMVTAPIKSKPHAVRIARAALHYWEEPPLSGYPDEMGRQKGSGTIFFSGCSLRCVYCQNEAISRGRIGKTVSVSRLAHIMLELQEEGALNINLVTPTHFWAPITEAVARARNAGLTLPIVANVAGAEKPKTILSLEDTVDIWLCDAKYFSNDLAEALSNAHAYWEVFTMALNAMLASNQRKGGLRIRADKTLLQGVIVRHLVLPGCVEDSKRVVQGLATYRKEYGENSFMLSIMNQYCPPHLGDLSEREREILRAYPELKRALTQAEYEEVLDEAERVGFSDIWIQEGGAASESFIPVFDYEGVEGPELEP